MVLPLALLLMFGLFDAGRYVWTLNQAEKAVQMGARYAVSTSLVASGLNTYETIGLTCPDDTLEPGDRICREALGAVRCTGTATAATCTCLRGPCPDLGETNAAAFGRIVARMRAIAPMLRAGNIAVTYSGSGIGYAGDPGLDDDGDPLSDISPLVTIEVSGLNLRAMTLFGGSITLPPVNATLTVEDGDGARAY
jgi:hypothetical protein